MDNPHNIHKVSIAITKKSTPYARLQELCNHVLLKELEQDGLLLSKKLEANSVRLRFSAYSVENSQLIAKKSIAILLYIESEDNNPQLKSDLT